MKTITYDDTLYQLVPKEATEIWCDRLLISGYFSAHATRRVQLRHCKELISAVLTCSPRVPTPPAQPEAVRVPPTKLWLWKNFVNGRPEYLAFDNPYPVRMDCGDPQTLGEPCGYAIFKTSRNGRPDVSEERVLEAIKVSSLKEVK